MSFLKKNRFITLGLFALLLLGIPAAIFLSQRQQDLRSKAATPTDHGYWLVGADGGVFSYNAPFYGSAADILLNKPITGVAIVATPSGKGYWLVASDGGVFAYGDAPFHGSLGSTVLNKPIVGMAATPTGKGYWLVASDGGIFSYGDAVFKGSLGSTVLNKPIVGMAATPTGQGYWLVGADGGVFAYGDATFHGSLATITLNKPVTGVGIISTPSGKGYWIVAADGGVFAFGDATFHGSLGSTVLNKPIVSMAASPSGKGYWLVAADGGIFAYGDAQFKGSLGGTTLNKPIVGMASAVPKLTTTPTNSPLPVPQACTNSQLVPFYRYYNPVGIGHFYTTKQEERERALRDGWNIDEGITGYIYQTQVSGTVPLHRYYNPTGVGHYYTIREDERTKALNSGWTMYEGVVGYIFATQAPGTVPLYRYYNPIGIGHFYTIKEEERARALRDGWNIDEGITGYINNSCGQETPTCSDGIDNNGNQLIDTADPVCHAGGNPNNPYDPNLPESGGNTSSGTSFIITALLHGIGISGDNVLPLPAQCVRPASSSANVSSQCFSNQNPTRPTRTATISISNNVTDQLIASASGNITYSNATGKYVGKVTTQSPLPAGTYNIRVKASQHLRRLIIPAKTISLTQDNLLPAVTLIAGDINNDNKLNILDYNILIDCYKTNESDPTPTTCTDSSKKQSADLNDNGPVNLDDYNLLIRNLSTQPGE